MSKTHSNAKLLNLPEDQQAQLADWALSGLPWYACLKLVKEQFGVTAGKDAFYGFYAVVCQPALIRRRKRAVETSEQLAEEAEKNPGQFDAATIDAIKQKAFELSIAPGAKPGDVKALFALVLKSRDQDLSKESLAFERRKFMTDAVQIAKDKLPELNAINAGPQSNAEKIELLGQAMFGEDWK